MIVVVPTHRASNKLILLVLSGNDDTFTLSADPCSFLAWTCAHVPISLLVDHFPLLLDELDRFLVFVLFDGFGKCGVEDQFARRGQRGDGFMLFVG